MRYLLIVFIIFSNPIFAASNDNRNLSVSQTNNAESAKRIALVIGNSAYTNSPLKNPVNDAKDMANKLRGLGFEVIERSNLQTRQIGGTLREFRSKLVPGAVGLVFYAGHGLQIKGINYLPAVDADINSEEDVPNQSLAVNQIMDVLDEAKTRLNLVFLDACRNNPYASRSFRSVERGLARVSAPSGTLVSYATKPGSVAADGDGRNGLYTGKLLAQMDSNLQIEQTLKRVVTEVKSASQGKQEPWMEGSIEGDFCFAGCSASGGTQVVSLVPVAVAHIKTHDEIEQDTWEGVRDSNNAGAVAEYLKQYPKGRFAGQARVLIATLKGSGARPVEPVTPVVVTPGRSDGESDLWAEVQKGNSRDDYDAYLAQYPKGKFVALARSRIVKLQEAAAAEADRREQEAWESADRTSSEDAYRSYLKGWPSGKYTGLAQVRIRKLQADRARADAEMKPGKVFKDCPDCPELVVLPAGSFTMGSGKGGDESPAHNVTIRQPFAMGRTEITRGQFASFVSATGYDAGNECYVLAGDQWEKRSGSNWRNPSFSQDDSHPVACINWTDAKAYVEWISRKTGKSYQLPSESQWEYACRAGGQNEYCGSDNVDSIAWYGRKNGDTTHPAAQKQVNAFGLYDMSGNVWEWTADSYHDSYNGAPNDGSEWSGDGAKRVLRGGSWSNNPQVSRAACRNYNSPADRDLNSGFRVSRTLP